MNTMQYRYLICAAIWLALPFNSFAEDRASALINNDVASQKYISDDLKPLERDKRNTVENTVNSSINASLYLQGLPITQDSSGNNQYDPLYMLHNHFGGGTAATAYCDQNSSEAGVGASCQSDPLIAHGDIKLSTLLASPLLDDTRAAAVHWFLQNLIDPFPNTAYQDPKALDAALKDPAKGQEVAKAIVQQAMLSVARQPFAEMVAKRSKTATGGSMMQKMEQDASQKYLNADWQAAQALGYKAQLTKQSGLEPLYDIAVLEAYRAWLDYERYKQGERIEALLAGILVQLGAGAKISAGISAEAKTQTVTPGGKLETGTPSSETSSGGTTTP